MADTTDIREIGCFKTSIEMGIIEISGPDSKRFLQAQTTNDLNNLPCGAGQKSCLLSRKAHIVGSFDLFNASCDCKNLYYIICDKEDCEPIIAHLDKFRFADKVEFSDRTGTGTCHLIEGKKSRWIIKEAVSGIPESTLLKNSTATSILFSKPARTFRKSISGEDGFLLWYEDGDVSQILSDVCLEHGLVPLTRELIETAAIESGILRFGIDFDSFNLISETSLEQTAVSYTKGCFQGQEVLSRVKSHGAPSRALVGLYLEPQRDTPFSVSTAIMKDGETIGWLMSNTYSQFLKRFIAIAMVKRDYRVPGAKIEVEIDAQPYLIEVELLPFYKPISADQEAKRLYDLALALYAREPESIDAATSKSVLYLRQALNLNPLMEDAYEALGVILSKAGKLDEAIELMHYLARLNPDSAMAHTNLSVFYLEKGDKDKAEDHKAESISIRMRQAAKQAMADKKRQDDEKEKEEETMSRMSMFEQVLKIDREDLLANYGLGSCLFTLGKFEQALPYLKKALEIKPTHSIAYLDMGKAYSSLGQNQQAITSFEKGIAVAAKRGDMEPLREMKEKLNELASVKGNN